MNHATLISLIKSEMIVNSLPSNPLRSAILSILASSSAVILVPILTIFFCIIQTSFYKSTDLFA